MHQVGEPLAGTERSIVVCANLSSSLTIAEKDTNRGKGDDDVTRMIVIV